MSLFPFQEQCVRTVLQDAASYRTGAVCLPTGSGKTRIAAAILAASYRQGAQPSSVILVHTNELMEQWEETLRTHVPHARISLVRGGRAKDWSGQIVIASVRAVGTRRGVPPRRVQFLMIDECHHALSDEWRQAIATFHSSYTLGLTATPVRGDGRCIAEDFGAIIYLLDLPYLIGLGRLVDAIGWRFQTNTDLSDLPLTPDGDYDLLTLGRRVNTASRNRQILDAYLRWGERKPAIVFCCDVAHAEAIAAEARGRDVRAETVHGGLSKLRRDALIAAFRQGELDMLTNCLVLTEGFDDPNATVAILARPYTVCSARVQEIQAIGRVLRVAVGKHCAIVLQPADQDRPGRAGDLGEVFGLSPGSAWQGELLNSVATSQRIEEGRRLAQALIDAVRDFVLPLCGESYTRPIIANDWERFDVIQHIQDVSGFHWLRLGAGRRYLNLGSGPDPDDSGRTLARSVEIRQTTGGLYAANLREGRHIIPLTVAATETDAQADVGRQLRARNDHGLSVALSRARWRDDVASDAQCALLERLTGVPAPVFEQLDRGRASDIITTLQGVAIR